MQQAATAWGRAWPCGHGRAVWNGQARVLPTGDCLAAGRSGARTHVRTRPHGFPALPLVAVLLPTCPVCCVPQARAA